MYDIEMASLTEHQRKELEYLIEQSLKMDSLRALYEQESLSCHEEDFQLLDKLMET